MLSLLKYYNLVYNWKLIYTTLSSYVFSFEDCWKLEGPMEWERIVGKDGSYLEQKHAKRC